MGCKILEDKKGERELIYVGNIKKKDDNVFSCKIAGGNLERFMFSPDGCILKQSKKTEMEFYIDISKGSNSLFFAENNLIRSFVPKFYEIIIQNEKKWIKMENVAAKITHASSFDIILWKKSFLPDDPPHKISSKSETDKSSISFLHGIKFGGLILMYDKESCFQKLNRDDSHTKNSKEYISLLFKRFLSYSNNEKINKDAKEFYLNFITGLLNLFEKQQISRCFFNSSLLFVLSNTINKYDIRWIDFENVWPCKSLKCDVDDGMITGLRTLYSIITSIN